MKEIKLEDILNFLTETNENPEYSGEKCIKINGFSSLKNYKPKTITWIKSIESIPAGMETKDITLIITQKGIVTNHSNTIHVNHGKKAFFDVLREFFGCNSEENLWHDFSYISNKARIGKNVHIGICCYICDNVIIEDNVIIGSHVTIESKTHIGSGSIIASGTKIGCPGFGFYKDETGENHRIEHFGGVWIGNNVEIGNNSVIHRGTIDDTYIGNNVKIECLTLIPHNVFIGDKCLILGQVGASCTIGEESYIAPRAYIKNGVKIGKHCMVGMDERQTENLPNGYISHRGRQKKYDYTKILNL